MPGPEMIGRILLAIGGLIVLAGLVFFLMGRFGLGRLPGDIYIQKENFSIYFPLTSGLIVSLILSLLLWIFFRR